MKFNVAFRINNRWSKYSRYSLREVAVCIVDRFSLTESEVEKVVALRPGEFFQNDDLRIVRVASTTAERLARKP